VVKLPTFQHPLTPPVVEFSQLREGAENSAPLSAPQRTYRWAVPSGGTTGPRGARPTVRESVYPQRRETPCARPFPLRGFAKAPREKCANCALFSAPRSTRCGGVLGASAWSQISKLENRPTTTSTNAPGQLYTTVSNPKGEKAPHTRLFSPLIFAKDNFHKYRIFPIYTPGLLPKAHLGGNHSTIRQRIFSPGHRQTARLELADPVP